MTGLLGDTAALSVPERPHESGLPLELQGQCPVLLWGTYQLRSSPNKCVTAKTLLSLSPHATLGVTQGAFKYGAYSDSPNCPQDGSFTYREHGGAEKGSCQLETGLLPCRGLALRPQNHSIPFNPSSTLPLLTLISAQYFCLLRF